MQERLTWKEIQEKYPEQWVGMVDIEWDNRSTVRSAVVKYSGKTSDELLKIKADSEIDMLVRYTAPDTLSPLGLVGYIS